MAKKVHKTVVKNADGLLEERAVSSSGEALFQNDPNAWASIFVDGADGSSIPNVSAEQAECFVTMQACIRIRAQSLSQMPLRVMRKTGRSWLEQESHPVNNLLKWTPNTEQNAIVWKRFGSRVADTEGNFYCWIARQQRQPIQLIPLAPGTTLPFREKGKNYFATTIEIEGKSQLMQIAPQDMIHVFYHPDRTGIVGRKPFTDLKASLAQGIQGRDYVSRVLAKGGNIGGWISHPSTFKGAGAAQKFRTEWDIAYSGIQNAGKTAVLQQGMEYNQLKPLSGTDAQTLENRRFTRDEIIGYYQIPPHMISVLDKANYNNLGSLDTYYIKHTMSPVTTAWEMELSLKLLTDEDRRAGFCIKFDYSEMRRGDPEQERQHAKDGITDGWLSRAEIRERNEMPEADAELERFTLPVNVAMLGDNDASTAGNGIDQSDEERNVKLLSPVVRSTLDKHLHVLGRAISKIANSDINLPADELAKQIGGVVDRSAKQLTQDLEPIVLSIDDESVINRGVTHFRSLAVSILNGNDLNAEADDMAQYLTDENDAKAVLYDQ